MSDIRFENIRCEDCPQYAGELLDRGRHVGARQDPWAHQGGDVQGHPGDGADVPVLKLTGFDDAHLIEDVRIENVRIQGSPIRSAETAKLQTNAYVRGLAIVAGPDEIQKSSNKVPEDTARKLADPQH